MPAPAVEQTPSQPASKPDAYDPLAVEEDTTLEPTPEAKKPEPPKSKHSPRHLEEARAYGFDMALVESIGVEELKAELHKTRVWLANEYRAITAQDTRREALEAKNAPKPAVAQPAAESVQVQAAGDDLDLDESWDPKLRTLAKTVKELREENAALKTTVQKRETQDFDAIIDDAIESLPTKFKSLLGEGPLADLIEAGNSKAQLRRMLIVNASGVLKAKGRLTPKKVHELIRTAAETVFDIPDAPAAAEKPSLYANGAAPAIQPAHHSHEQPRVNGRFTQEQWEQAGLARPTNRAEQAVPDGKKKATENLAARLEQMGYHASGDATLDDFM